MIGRASGSLEATAPGTTLRRKRAVDVRPAAGGRGAGGRPSAVSVRRATRLVRDRHEPDYAILVSVVALAAIGILMVYASSGIKAYLGRNDTMAIVGPQILWAALGVAAMLLVSRLDYRYLRLVAVPGFLVAILLLVVVLLPPMGPLQPIEVGGSARWLQVGPLPAVHPAEFAKLALVVYLAFWFARRGTRVRSFWRGTVPFLVIAGPVAFLIFREPDLGTTIVVTATAFTMFFVAGANLFHLLALGAAAVGAVAVIGLKSYQLERIQAWLNPWADPLGAGFHTIQGLFALGLGGLFGIGLGESRAAGGLYLPNAWNDFIFAIIGEEFGFLGAGLVIVLFLVLAVQGARVALHAPDTFGALLAAGITAWLCIQAFINIGVVVALFPVTGITLPFISAGGSSLIISFAAVGILLSISRETVDMETVEDAPADRGRGDGRAHLPGPGRGPLAPRSPGRP
jgi:cell division protein FtsW